MATNTMQKIAALEDERQALLNSADDWTFADAARIGRIRDIKSQLESLWNIERQQRANARNPEAIRSRLRSI